MARPRTERWWDGVRLSDNLYPDAHKRAGYWRYRRPDRSFKTFYAKTVQEANKIADHNNELRKRPVCDLDRQVDEYIAFREGDDPKLDGKASWRNRKQHLKAFAREFDTPAHRLTREQIRQWWLGLSFYQQKARHAEFRRFFNYLMSEGVVDMAYNPFTLADDRPRLYTKGAPEKARQRLTRDDFWAIYDSAGELGYEGLQIAMGLSLTTFMREGDICSLTLSQNLESDLLKLVVGKSANQRGVTQAARLQWDVGYHQMVRTLLSKSRKLSMVNYRCPFVISHKPRARRPSKTKEHHCQVLPRRLISMFKEARVHAGIVVQEGNTPPTFHEIRSLASKLARDAGYQIGEIQEVMAHESENVTKGYMEGHALPYESVGVVFTEDMCGRAFK